MVFTSWSFAFFFCAFLALLLLLRTRAQRLTLILLASAIFYASWDYRFLPIIVLPGVIDYWCAIRIEERLEHRKRWLVFSIAFNLGLLAYFKYTNFFIDEIAMLIRTTPQHLSIVLPIGISFFTFKTMSYTIDVYRGEVPACRSLKKYLTFIMYFPELIAGPIVRASVLLPQFARSLRPSWPRLVFGAEIALMGVSKKLLIADRVAIFVDEVFARPQIFDSMTLALAVLAYALQIYCDFSGYSDIAIGISKIIGLDLPENFNMPYLATSVTEFWRRWHMTLSSWLRDYLYIPLGGNRRGIWATHRNLMITMLLGGLWHGASWHFVIWGALHGFYLIVGRAWSRFLPRTTKFQVVPHWLITFAAVTFAWIFFRAADLPTAWLIVRRIFQLNATGIKWLYSPFFMVLPLVIIGHIIGVAIARRSKRLGKPNRSDFRIMPVSAVSIVYPRRSTAGYAFVHLNTFSGAFIVVSWLLLLVLFGALQSSPFIYFQF